jgi:hypothetical protein
MQANTQAPDNYTKNVANELVYELFDNKIISNQDLFSFIPFN